LWLQQPKEMRKVVRVTAASMHASWARQPVSARRQCESAVTEATMKVMKQWQQRQSQANRLLARPRAMQSVKLCSLWQRREKKRQQQLEGMAPVQGKLMQRKGQPQWRTRMPQRHPSASVHAAAEGCWEAPTAISPSFCPCCCRSLQLLLEPLKQRRAKLLRRLWREEHRAKKQLTVSLLQGAWQQRRMQRAMKARQVQQRLSEKSPRFQRHV
jgi:hypothetical protein